MPIIKSQFLRQTNTAVQIFSMLLCIGFSMFSSHAAANYPESLKNELETFFQSPAEFSVAGVRLRHKDILNSIYAQRQFKPMWTNQTGITYTGNAVLNKLVKANGIGLDPSRYYTAALGNWSKNGAEQNHHRFEILLSDSLYEYFDNLAHGQLQPETPKNGWHLKNSVIDVRSITAPFFAGETSFREVVKQLQPTNPRYHTLVDALASHIEIQQSGGWVSIPRGATLRHGDKDERIATVKRRLVQSGDLSGFDSGNENEFDKQLKQSLIAFQRRHGLDPDGVLGQDTIGQLNIPVADRITQLEINIDRWRWLARDFGNRHVLVNVPGFEMDLIENNESLIQMPVIVGKQKNKTPLFSDVMDHIVFNPSWYVPNSITRKYLAKENASPGYLSNRNFEAISHHSKTRIPVEQLSLSQLQVSEFLPNYTLRQKPGKNNALGKLKFMFPNNFSIYMHDTPEKRLFSETERAFSHGCVRLAQPTALAKAVLKAEGRSASEIEKLTNTRSNKKLVLREKVPVHLTYQTTWVNSEGVTQFRKDIYGHDRRAIEKLKQSEAHFAVLDKQLSGRETIASSDL